MVFYSAIHSPSALFSTKLFSRELSSSLNVAKSNEEEAGVDVAKLPPIVVKVFLQLHCQVKEKHRKLRNAQSQPVSRKSNAFAANDQLLISGPSKTTAQTTASTDVVVAGPNTTACLATVRFGNRKAKTKLEHYAEVHAEIAKATQQTEIGLFTQKFVRECGLSGHAAVGHAAVPKVRRDFSADTIMLESSPGALNAAERSVLVQLLTGVYGDDHELPLHIMNSRAHENTNKETKQLAAVLSSADKASASAAVRSTASVQNSGVESGVQSELEPTACQVPGIAVRTATEDLAQTEFSSFLVHQRNPNPFNLNTTLPHQDSGNVSMFVHAWRVLTLGRATACHLKSAATNLVLKFHEVLRPLGLDFTFHKGTTTN